MKTITAALAVCAICAASAAHAVTYYFEAALDIDESSPDIPGSVVDIAAAFPVITGTLTFDQSSKLPLVFPLDAAAYDAPVLLVDQFNTAGLTAGPSGGTTLYDDVEVISGDIIDAVFTGNNGLTGLPAGIYEQFAFSISDDTNSVLGDTDLPVVTDFSDWTAGTLSFSVSDWSGSTFNASEFVIFEVTDFTTVPPGVGVIPLPAGLPLLAVGLIGLGAAARRRRGPTL
ncbi:MAG: VPLPA-CTERM sorting domain-containing protein [Pseudomonadota bacterium]